MFKDEDTALLILKSHSPRDQKALGRKVHNFDDEVWTANCKEIVKTGNMAKVSYMTITKICKTNLSASGLTLSWDITGLYPAEYVNLLAGFPW